MVKQIIKEQRKQNTFYEKVRIIAEEPNIKLEVSETMKKSDWIRKIKDKFHNKIPERVEKRMKNKIKLRTVRKDKWERNEYIATATYGCDIIKEIIKIRLYHISRNWKRTIQEKTT